MFSLQPKTQSNREDVRAKYNTSREPNSLSVVVIVETEITAPGGIVAPGQGVKSGPLLLTLETSRLESRVGLIDPMNRASARIESVRN
jgi:hypothetical protein